MAYAVIVSIAPCPRPGATVQCQMDRHVLVAKRLRLATCAGQEDGQHETGYAGVECAACECDLETAAGR